MSTLRHRQETSCRAYGAQTSRAFIKLRTPQLAPLLKHVLEHSPFESSEGVPYFCEMAPAPNFKVPKARKQDPKAGTYLKGAALVLATR